MAKFKITPAQKEVVKWIGIVAGAIIVVVGLWLMFGPQRKVEVSASALIVGRDKSVDFTAALMARGWFGGPRRVAGTITPIAGSIVKVTPSEAATTPETPRATFTVTGSLMGRGKIRLRGSSAAGIHDTAEVEVIVTRGT